MRLVLLALLAGSVACTARVGFGGPGVGDAPASVGDAPASGDDTRDGDSIPTCPLDSLRLDYPLEHQPVGWGVPLRGVCSGSTPVTVTAGGVALAPLACAQGRFTGFRELASIVALGATTLEITQGICTAARELNRTTAVCDSPAARMRTLTDGLAAGTGAFDDPFVICTAAQLTQIDENLAAHFELRNDIDLTFADSNGDGVTDAADPVVDPWPVLAADPDGDGSNGFGGTPFSGRLVGHGHAVLGLRLDSAAGYQGLFGFVSGTVRHLSLRDVSISATGAHAGALAGAADGDLRAIYVTGTIDGHNQTGGVVGLLEDGVLLDAMVEARVEGTANVGGLTGAAIGEIRYGTVRGAVSGEINVGGIVGEGTGTFSDLETDVDVQSSVALAGGIAGALAGGSLRSVLVRGPVSATADAAAIANGTATVNQAFFGEHLGASAYGTAVSDAELLVAATFSGFDQGLWEITDGTIPALRSQPCVRNPAWTAGAGTAASPYAVSTPRELHCVRIQLNGHFRQSNDLDLTPVAPWVPIGHDRDWDRTAGSSADNFTGEYDGGGFAIVGLSIQRGGADYIGLFARSQQRGWIHDFNLEGDVRGRALVGLLIGGDHFTGGAPAYENLVLTGTVDGAYLTGGVVGGSTALVANVHIDVQVVGSGDTGGVAGGMGNARGISEVSFNGSVSGTNSVGGAVGRCYTTEGPLDDFTFVGTVVGSGDRVGGVTGRNTCRIRRATVTADVTGSNYVGGVVGWDYFDSDDPSEITDSVVQSGTIAGGNFVGGLAGYNESAPVQRSWVGAAVEVVATGHHAGGLVGDNYTVVRDSFALAPVSGLPPSGGLIGDNGGTSGEGLVERCFSAGMVNLGAFALDIGGLIGNNDGASAGTGTVTDSFWDVTSSGLGSDESTAESEGGVGKSTAKLRQQTTFSGWDFTTVWIIDEGNDYPRLR